MYRPSIEEMVAFGNLTFIGCDMYFENVDAHIIDANVEDITKKLYLRFLGMAEIACNTPEFFGYGVPDGYYCGGERIYFQPTNKVDKPDKIVVDGIKNVCERMKKGEFCNCSYRTRSYKFSSYNDAKSFMFRLVLCWMKQQSEKENNG